MSTVKAGVYLRISEDKTGEQLGIMRHREDCLKICAEKGWEPVEYVDNDISSKAGTPRPAYRQMLADIESGALQAVVCWHTDRLTRQPIENEQFITLVAKMGIESNLATATGEIDLSTDDGRFMFRMLGILAKKEMERKSARQKSASRQKAEMGKAHSTGRAFGYDGDGNLIFEEANAIRSAYQAMGAGGALYGIAKTWNDAGLRSTRGNLWTGRTVRQVLINPRYAGLRSYLGEIVTDAKGKPVKAEWKPVVSREVWEDTRRILTAPSRFTGKSKGRKHLLTGLAICGECGHTMGSMIHTGKRAGYICKKCHGVSRNMAAVDQLVIDVITARLSQPDAAVVLAKPTADTSVLTDESNRLRARIAAAESDYDEGLIDARRMNAAIEKANVRMAEVDAKLLDANASRALDGLVGKADAAARFGKLSLDRRRKVVDTLCTVTIRKARRGSRFDHRLIEITWR